MSSRPFMILIAVVAVTVVAAAFLTRVDLTTPPPEPPAPTVEALPEPTPPAEDPEDFSTTRRLAKEDVLPLYEGLRRRRDEYFSVQMRCRLEFPDYVPDRTIESEIRFDAFRPDRWIKTIYASTPPADNNPDAEWEFKQMSGNLFDDPLWREAIFKNRSVFDHRLDATAEILVDLLAHQRENLEAQFDNPYQDILGDIPLEDRIKEIVQTERVKTSEGDEIRVLHRINARMAKELGLGNLREYFPVCPDCMKTLSLREDVFDAESGDLLRMVYFKPDRTAYLIHRVVSAVWDEDIPDDRFEMELPTPHRFVDMNKLTLHKSKLPTREEGMKMLEDGDTDWPTLIENAKWE